TGPIPRICRSGQRLAPTTRSTDHAGTKPGDAMQTNQPLAAVVFSGSGCSSTAAYEIGVMRALLEKSQSHLNGEPFDPGIYAGSGFGSFNAAVMTSNVGEETAATLNYLESAWLDGLCSTAIRANGVYRFRANPLALFDPRAW